MTDDTIQRTRDAEEHRKSYSTIMTRSSQLGVPFALALAMFFTQLVLANGILVATGLGIATFIAVYLVVKTFFSH